MHKTSRTHLNSAVIQLLSYKTVRQLLFGKVSHVKGEISLKFL